LHSILIPYANSSQTSGEKINLVGKKENDDTNDLPDADA